MNTTRTVSASTSRVAACAAFAALFLAGCAVETGESVEEPETVAAGEELINEDTDPTPSDTTPPSVPSVNLVYNGQMETCSSVFGAICYGSGWGQTLREGDGYAGNIFPSYPYQGLRTMVLGFSTKATGGLGQTIAIPATATYANLGFQLSVATTRTEAAPLDWLRVEVVDWAKVVPTKVISFDNIADTTAYQSVGPIDLSAFRGRTVSLAFRVTFYEATHFDTKPGYTTFRIDNVVLFAPKNW